MNISDTTNALKNMWDLFSDANELAKKAENLELQKMLNELQQQIILLERQLNEKDRALLEYEKAQTLEQDLTFERNLYWKIDSSDKKVGPFCPKCKDGDGKLARMTIHSDSNRCPVCAHIEWHPQY